MGTFLSVQWVKLALGWTNRFNPIFIKRKKTSSRTVWTTFFPKLLKLTSKEKSLKPEATVTYRNPPTLAKNLQNYKQLALQINDDRPSSFPCGNYGQHNSMIQHTEVISRAIFL